ncbi:CC/Se motif family (seleno)protein [Ureibacillus sp. NPDC094379]
MKFEIDEDAKKWIESKGGQLIVKIVEVNVCCAPGVQELLTLVGKPKDIGIYHEFKVGSLLIYVQKHITMKEKLILKLSGFGFFKTISVKNV